MNLEKLCAKVIDTCMNVGEFIRREAMNFDKNKIEYKGLNDLVSYVDKTAETMIVQDLMGILPEAGFITEEESVKAINSEYTWIVDPLDGTTNFIHGLPVYAISIALMKGTESLIGVVYEINRNECFYAVKSGNAYCNKKQIFVSRVPALSQSLIATGFPYFSFEKMPEYLNILNTLMQKSHGLRRFGSAATDLAYVACGRFEGFFEYNLSPWDVAGGALIVKQAGGTITDFNGGENFIFGKSLIAASANTHGEILDVIKKMWRDNS